MSHPGYPVAAGSPQHSGSYIPNLFAAKLLIEFYKASVMASVTTTEYEEPIKKFGDKLTIRSLPAIVSKDYVKGQNLDIQTPEGGKVDLLIDKGKYWAIAINALDRKQSDLDYVGKWATHAATTQKVVIDGDVLQNVYADADAQNRGSNAGEDQNIDLGATGAWVQLQKTDIIDKIIDCGVILDQQNVPDEGRYIVLPSWAIGLLKTSDIKNANEMGDAKSPLRNGRVGMIDRFEVFMSNNLLTSDDGGVAVSNCLFGHKACIAFASQMMETESLKNPNDFGDIIRSLQAYGYKTIKPEGVGTLYASATPTP
jgi:hypothetical protein